jgi:hypothetical protein
MLCRPTKIESHRKLYFSVELGLNETKKLSSEIREKVGQWQESKAQDSIEL